LAAEGCERDQRSIESVSRRDKIGSVSRKPLDVDPQAAIRWISREEYETYFKSLPPEDRWTHPHYPHQPMVWHWDERRWWAMEES
jgi:hypothetical protein